MLEKIEKIRKAPQHVKEHLVSIVTVIVVAGITLVWFLFSISSFLKHDAPQSSVSTPAQSQTEATSTGIKTPFAL